MISPRWAGLLFGLIGTVGMAVMAWTKSFWIAVLGGALVAGDALTWFSRCGGLPRRIDGISSSGCAH